MVNLFFTQSENRISGKPGRLYGVFCLLLIGGLAQPVVAWVDDPFSQTCQVGEPFADPHPATWMIEGEEPFVPTEAQSTLIGRLAQGIYHWKVGRDHGWWECGQMIPRGAAAEDRAIMLAYQLVRAAHKYSDEHTTINVWGLAATMAHESSFDRCAVGYHFRKWAIDKKLIKPRTRTISYSQAELLKAMYSPQARWWFDSTGVDVGYCQLLTRFHHGPTWEMMDEVKGVDICAAQFRFRSKRLKTNRPWRWWRGYKATWYDDRVTTRAMALGAHPDEI